MTEADDILELGVVHVLDHAALDAKEEAAAAELLRHSPAAWSVLEYASADGAERERVWNAREGAPCLGIASRDTGQRMQMTGRYTRDRHYRPKVGDRVWIDMTEQTARVEAARRVEAADAFGAGLPSFASREAAIDHVQRLILARGEPHLLTVTSAWLEDTRLASNVYDREGNPILSLDEFSARFEDAAYRQVAQTTIGHGPHTIVISTVWLGSDYSFGASPRPLIFETMAIACGEVSDKRIRYSTEAAAIVGHVQAVARMRAAVHRLPAEPCSNPDHWPTGPAHVVYCVRGQTKTTPPYDSVSAASAAAADIAGYDGVTEVTVRMVKP